MNLKNIFKRTKAFDLRDYFEDCHQRKHTKNGTAIWETSLLDQWILSLNVDGKIYERAFKKKKSWGEKPSLEDLEKMFTEIMTEAKNDRRQNNDNI